MQRRNILKSIGALAAFGNLGIATANHTRNTGRDNVSETGFQNQLLQAYEKDGVDGYKDVFERHNRDYNINEGPVPGIVGDAPDITPDDRYSESNSNVRLLLGEAFEDDQIWVTVSAHLQTRRKRVRTATAVDDVIGATFNSNDWSVVGNIITSINDPEDVHDIGLYSESLDGGGVAAKVDIGHTGGVNATLPEEAYVTLQFRLESTGGPHSTILGAYEHTYAPAGYGTISSISGGNVLEVVLSYSAETAWDTAEDGDPAPLL